MSRTIEQGDSDRRSNSRNRAKARLAAALAVVGVATACTTSSTSGHGAAPRPSSSTGSIDLSIFNADYPACDTSQRDVALPHFETDFKKNMATPPDADSTFKRLASAAHEINKPYYGVAEPTGFFMQVLYNSNTGIGVRYLYDKGDEANVICSAFNIVLGPGDTATQVRMAVGSTQAESYPILISSGHLTQRNGDPLTKPVAAEFATVAAYAIQGFDGQVVGQ